MDRRVARTRRSLREALVGLVLERGWDAVGVRDVCARADVGRSTFYAHFGDKETLLVSGFDELRAELRAAWPAGDPPLGFVRGLADHAEAHRKLHRAMLGRRSGAVVQGRFRALVRELVAEDLAGADAVTVEYAAGGVFAVLSAWVDQRNASVDEVVAAVQRLTAPLTG